MPTRTRARPRTTRTTRTRRQPSVKKATIGRLGEEEHTISYRGSLTVQQLLDKAGLTAYSGEEVINEAGNSVDLGTNVQAGKEYFLSGNSKSGK